MTIYTTEQALNPEEKKEIHGDYLDVEIQMSDEKKALTSGSDWGTLEEDYTVYNDTTIPVVSASRLAAIRRQRKIRRRNMWLLPLLLLGMIVGITMCIFGSMQLWSGMYYSAEDDYTSRCGVGIVDMSKYNDTERAEALRSAQEDKDVKNRVDCVEDIDILGPVETMTVPKQGNSAGAVIRHDFDTVEEKKFLPLETKTISIDIDNNICVISYIEVNSTGNKPKLLLLHGAAFNATTWDNQTGTMSKLREWGYRAVAVNLSPYTFPCLDDLSETKGVLMHKLVESLKLQKVVIVSPAMSGVFSIPYVTSEAYQGEIAAYIPIAPVIASTYKADDFSPLNKLKTMIVRGANDKMLGLSSLTLLEKIPNHRNVIIPDAGHPCYVEKPHVWHSELKTFLDSLEPTAV